MFFYNITIKENYINIFIFIMNAYLKNKIKSTSWTFVINEIKSLLKGDVGVLKFDFDENIKIWIYKDWIEWTKKFMYWISVTTKDWNTTFSKKVKNVSDLSSILQKVFKSQKK